MQTVLLSAAEPFPEMVLFWHHPQQPTLGGLHLPLPCPGKQDTSPGALSFYLLVIVTPVHQNVGPKVGVKEQTLTRVGYSPAPKSLQAPS